MKWRKLGQIFDPTQHKLPNDCVEYAKSPQALVFDDFVRIYFSTCAKDGQGKADQPCCIRRTCRKTCGTLFVFLTRQWSHLAGLGCFDEHGIFPMNVVRHRDLVYGYTSGWSRRVSVSVETAIGLAISNDEGLTFERYGDGPVLAASLHEPCLVVDGFVKVIGDTFHMWYIFGTGWRQFAPEAPPDRTYKIGHATSRDGIKWVKEEARQIIPDRIGLG